MRDGTIAAGFARALVTLATSRGADGAELLTRAGIAREDLEDVDGRLPLARYLALMRAAKVLCREPALALHFGEAFDLADLSIVGVVGRGEGTVLDSVTAMNRFAPLALDVGCDDGERFRLERAGTDWWVVDTREDAEASPELTESAFARAITSSRRRFGTLSYLGEVHLTHPAPPYRQEYLRVFGVPVVFDSDRNAMRMHPGWARLRVPPAPAYVRQVLAARAESLLRDLAQAPSMRSRVERLVRRMLERRAVSVERVAAALALSRQTLFRHLKVEGVTYAQVVDEVRRQRALRCLQGRGATVKQAAYLAGFSDPSAFSRAFRRWTGSTPGRFQARQGTPPGAP